MNELIKVEPLKDNTDDVEQIPDEVN